MNGKITESLCALHSPGLLEATSHSEPAQRIAARYLRHNAVLGNQYWPQMTPPTRSAQSAFQKWPVRFWLVNESVGIW